MLSHSKKERLSGSQRGFHQVLRKRKEKRGKIEEKRKVSARRKLIVLMHLLVIDIKQ